MNLLRRRNKEISGRYTFCRCCFHMSSSLKQELTWPYGTPVRTPSPCSHFHITGMLPAVWGFSYFFSVFLAKYLVVTYRIVPPILFLTLTLWRRTLLEKLTVAYWAKKLPSFYGTKRSVAVFTRSGQWVPTLCGMNPLHMFATCFLVLVLISFHLLLGLTSDLFRFYMTIFCAFSLSLFFLAR